jgi:hypothetical protein
MIYNMTTIYIPYNTSATTGRRANASETSLLSKRENPLPLEWAIKETMTTT